MVCKSFLEQPSYLLRKFVYLLSICLQDRCPLCHDILYKIESENDSKITDGHFPRQEGEEEEMVR